MGGVGLIVLLLSMLSLLLFILLDCSCGVATEGHQCWRQERPISMFLQRTGAGGKMYTQINDFGYVFCDSALGKSTDTGCK